MSPTAGDYAMRSMFLIVALSFAQLVLAQESPKPLTPEETAKKVDEKVVLQMEVKSTGGNTAVFLNSMTDYRNRKNFAIFIPREALTAFRKVQIDDPAEYYKGKTIQVTGTVSVYRGQVEIKVDDPAQIKIVEKTAETKELPPTPSATKGEGGKPN
jgi:DNA/RNA endonuclease YhcR with UshA esterase domain